jgi:hypothetical protein
MGNQDIQAMHDQTIPSVGSYDSPMTIKMNLEPTALLALALVLTLGSSSVCRAEQLIQLPHDTHKALARSGSLQSPNGRCKANLQVSVEGGFLVLSVTSPTARSAELSDVTGIAWIDREMLIYTVSPIYGKPGLFLLDCRSMQTKRVIGPRSIGVSYPDGADYFELTGISGSSGKIYFYYSPDVDRTDFRVFRITKNLCFVGIGDLPQKSARDKSGEHCNAPASRGSHNEIGSDPMRPML